MTIKKLYNYIQNKIPIEKIPISWDKMGYTSKSFNMYVSSLSFTGWDGELPTDKEVEIITELLNIHPNKILLDIACGYGRHALLFAQNYDLKVTGIDISSGLIKTAKRLAKEKGLEIQFEVKNAKALTWRGCFDYVIVVFNSFSLFSPSDVGIVLKNIWNTLRPGGKFFLDLDNKPIYCGDGTYHRDWQIFKRSIKLQEVYYHKNISVEVCRDLYANIDIDEIEEFIVFKRIYSENEIRQLLYENGFKIKKIYGGWDLSTLEDNSSKIIIVAMKEEVSNLA